MNKIPEDEIFEKFLSENDALSKAGMTFIKSPEDAHFLLEYDEAVKVELESTYCELSDQARVLMVDDVEDSASPVPALTLDLIRSLVKNAVVVKNLAQSRYAFVGTLLQGGAFSGDEKAAAEEEMDRLTEMGMNAQQVLDVVARGTDGVN